MCGLSLLTRQSDGGICLASYHPRKSRTWYWSITIGKNVYGYGVSRAARRLGQWHDYYPLPFGWLLTVGIQDYHRARP